MLTILKVYRGESESSPLLQYIPPGPQQNLCDDQKKKHPFLYEDVVTFQGHDWAGGKLDRWISFSTHELQPGPFYSAQP